MGDLHKGMKGNGLIVYHSVNNNYKLHGLSQPASSIASFVHSGLIWLGRIIHAAVHLPLPRNMKNGQRNKQVHMSQHQCIYIPCSEGVLVPRCLGASFWLNCYSQEDTLKPSTEPDNFLNGILCGQVYGSSHAIHARQNPLDQGGGTQIPGLALGSLLRLSASIAGVSLQEAQRLYQHWKAETHRKGLWVTLKYKCILDCAAPVIRWFPRLIPPEWAFFFLHQPFLPIHA